MKCPYNNFEECFGAECPAYIEVMYSYRENLKYCKYVKDNVTPPNGSQTIINNYYNKEQN